MVDQTPAPATLGYGFKTALLLSTIYLSSQLYLSICDLSIYLSILYYLAARPSRNNVRCTWTPREASARRYRYTRDEDGCSVHGCLSPLQCSMPILQLAFTALRDANDALLGVHCITRITRSHFKCFSDPRFGALSPGKLRGSPSQTVPSRGPPPATPPLLTSFGLRL